MEILRGKEARGLILISKWFRKGNTGEGDEAKVANIENNMAKIDVIKQTCTES